jgi:outer membrane receptor for ferrienterochelin and colicin
MTYRILKSIILLVFLFTVPLVFSQTGIIKGVVKDKKTGETLVGVNVWIESISKGNSTDFNGEFVINNVPAGIYRLSVSIISYKKLFFENIHVTKDKITNIDIDLEEEVTQMQEVEIVDKRSTNSEISIINSIKSTNLVANGISGQQITKSLDRDASEVIRRVPGITIFNGKFVVVRGLNQRYNSVFLNNASTPSAETDSRAFSFDIIPSSLLDNIMIYKTPSPELPADFSGAFIDVTTKNSPSKNTTDVSYTFSVRENTTFNTFASYKGGSLDFLGIDNGSRALPDGFPSTGKFNQMANGYTVADREEITKLGQEINKSWTSHENNALWDNRLNIAIAQKFKIGKIQAGAINALNYSNTFESLPIHRLDYQVYNFQEDKPSLNFDFHDLQYTNTAKTGILSNWSFILNPRTRLSFNNLFNQIGYSRTTLREGTEYYSSQQIRSAEYSFMSRTTYSGQISGNHDFLKPSSHLRWTIGYSYSQRNEPNQKRLTTILNTTPSDPYYNRYGIAFGNTASPKYAGIIYQNLKEHLAMARIDYTCPFTFGSFKPELHVGMYGEYKYRKFDARLLGFIKSNEDLFNQALPYLPFDSVFMDQNINNTTGIKIAETTNPSDSYDANNLQIAGYFTLKIPIGKRISIYTGVRVEDNRQQLNSFSSDLSTLPIHVDNNAISFFPSINLTLDISEKSLIRFAYGRSINRPEFREIAPFNFYVFQENASFVGNPKLKDAFIHNLDARFELYPSLSEMISVGIFYKKFIHPIEISYINSGSGLAYGPTNANGAYSYGAEIEIRQSFTFFGRNGIIPKWLQAFSIVLNASVIKSQVEFSDNSQERNRYMQGQSPFIVNAGLYYQSEESKWTSSLLYNIMGKRIVIVGQANQNAREDIPDIYEMPLHSLDFTISKKIGKHIQLKGGIQNILNEKVRYQQTVKFDKPGVGMVSRIQPTLEYKSGRYYSVGIGVSF